MIAKLKINNFKCYKNCTLKFKNFNVICGPNSSGKSTINQAILFILQNNHGSISRLTTNGKFVHFDQFEEMKNEEISADQNILISIKNEKGEENLIEIGNSRDDNKIVCVRNEQQFHFLEEDDIYFLSADRIGPEDVYDKYNDNLIGIQGQNAIGFIAKNKDKPIDEKYAFEKHPTKDYNFKKELDYWLNEIIGEEIDAIDLDRTDRSYATYKKRGHSLQVRNKNTGSGISYMIALLTLVFSISIKNETKMPTFIIENPEIHLHPSAQIKLMKFLVFMSQFCQIIVETHSDHIIKDVLDVRNGQIIKLKNFNPEYFDKENAHILPMATIGEIKWSAFDLPTVDFHVALYSFLQTKFKKSSINGTDDAIRKTNCFKKNANQFETGFPRFNKTRAKGNILTETLPTYLRNLIDHPEPNRNLYRNENEFDNKLKESIQFMIDIIVEKHWN